MSQVELDYDPNGQKRKKNNGSFSNHHKIELGSRSPKRKDEKNR